MKLFRTAKELVDYLQINKGVQLSQHGEQWTYSMNGNMEFTFDTSINRYSLTENGIPIKADRDTSMDLTKPENHSVVMLLINILERGYAFSSITLEKKWQTGHDPIWLDVMLKSPTSDDIYMIEVKKYDEYLRYADAYNESKVKQLCSYAMQEQATKIASFYSYDFDKEQHCFSNIFCTELRQVSLNTDDFYDRWHKIFDHSNYISNNNPFDIQKYVLKYSDLREIDNSDTKLLFYQFLTILRLNSISDKPTAFMKMINLFLAKLSDEFAQDYDFVSIDNNGNCFSHTGLRFQYIDDESPESFMKRLNELYKSGMKKYLNKDVIDYTDNELSPLISGGNRAVLMKAFDNLRLKKNNSFSFIEVYDDNTFLENFGVVKEIVKLLQNFKFKYDTKHQFLGDFFEDLLNTSLKQEEGQFFTPYPLVDFMVNSLDIQERINMNLQNRNLDFIPKMIDYACGAGHFLISAMRAVQDALSAIIPITTDQKRRIESYRSYPYSWANELHVVGIEKDYRLAKTTKIATFLNGDGEAQIIAGDGINKFDSDDYNGTILASKTNKLETFDYVISNPPYSVEGFMQNFRRNGITENSSTFSLLDSINPKDAKIEVFFVERAEQLLKDGGIAAIILPQSVLSGDKYNPLRTFIKQNFRIMSMLLTADITFLGTTTSPVILFLRKEKAADDYEILIHQSPKYSTPKAPKLKEQEVEFLGYEFSSNKNKSGITLKKNSTLEQLVGVTNDFICHRSLKTHTINPKFSKIVKLSDITLNQTHDYCGDIYPKRIISQGNPISTYCKINERKASDFTILPTNYLEIGDLSTQIPSKKLKSTRFCKKGDILISSLLPEKDKIVISTDDFMLTPAVYVLSSFPNESVRDMVFSKLRMKTTLDQMCALVDGFKITYAKINEKNLYNNVLI